jgi:hypothetical protein
MCKSWQQRANFEKIRSSKLVELKSLFDKCKPMPKICFDQLPFLLLLQLSTNVAESTQEQTQECTHRLTQTELQISLCSHHTLLRQAIKLTLATATSPHLCTLTPTVLSHLCNWCTQHHGAHMECLSTVGSSMHTS